MEIPTTVRYRECQRNHAAQTGNRVLDGCGEFMPKGKEGTPESMRCAACDCHRNFHRREVQRIWNDQEVGEGSRKRMRTKFTMEQKEKMMEFADKIGWRIVHKQVDGEDEIHKFCEEIGVTRQVFKVWMHNNKQAIKRKSQSQLHS